MYLGIDSFFVFSGYILCVVSAVLCVAYGLINWNKGNENISSEDLQWADAEQQVEGEL